MRRPPKRASDSSLYSLYLEKEIECLSLKKNNLTEERSKIVLEKEKIKEETRKIILEKELLELQILKIRKETVDLTSWPEI